MLLLLMLILLSPLPLIVVSSILLVHGIASAFRRSKCRRLEAGDFPGVPSDKFEEWRRLELKSIDILLWTQWGLVAISAIFAIFVLRPLLRSGEYYAGLFLFGAYVLFYPAYLVLLLVGLMISASCGSEAKSLKKSLGIEWPGKG